MLNTQSTQSTQFVILPQPYMIYPNQTYMVYPNQVNYVANHIANGYEEYGYGYGYEYGNEYGLPNQYYPIYSNQEYYPEETFNKNTFNLEQQSQEVEYHLNQQARKVSFSKLKPKSKVYRQYPERYSKFGKKCWHCEYSNSKNKLKFIQVEHDFTNECSLLSCKYGEKCLQFNYIKNGLGEKEQTKKYDDCKKHCMIYSHKKTKKSEDFQKIMEYLKSDTIDNNGIRKIITSPGFDINYTEVKRGNELVWQDKLQVKKFDAGMYNLLGMICRYCSFEIFAIALNCSKARIDRFTLMSCVLKKDTKYLELIGRNEFAKHHDLSVPCGFNDSRITLDYYSTINYLKITDLLIRDDFIDVTKKFVEWKLFM